MSFTTTFYLPDDEPLVVEFDITPGRPGRLYLSNGDPGYPPEPAEVDIISVLRAGTEILPTLPTPLFDKIVDHCMDVGLEYLSDTDSTPYE